MCQCHSVSANLTLNRKWCTQRLLPAYSSANEWGMPILADSRQKSVTIAMSLEQSQKEVGFYLF